MLKVDMLRGKVQVLSSRRGVPSGPLVGPHQEATQWQNWQERAQVIAGRWLNRTHTLASDSPEATEARDALQTLFNEWEKCVADEMADLFGYEELPPQQFKVARKTMAQVLRARDSTQYERAGPLEWLRKRMCELLGHLRAGLNRKHTYGGLCSSAGKS